MRYSYSFAQVRAADALEIEKGTPASVLMQRAGEALASHASRVLKERAVGEVLFVCGGGNNGRDGFVAARILMERGVDAAVLCPSEKFSEECARAKAKFRGEVFGRMPRRFYPVVVDCILGTGISRAPEGSAEDLIHFVNSSGAYVIACDLPSGLSENGIALGACVRADETVCMGALKNALLMADGADLAGRVSVAEIGIHAEGGAEIWENGDVKALFPPRKSHSNKGNYGTAAIVGGTAGVGAAFLAAGACLKSGCGYTKLFLPQEIYPLAIGKLNACILREFHKIDEEIIKADVVALGMGFGSGKPIYEYIALLLRRYEGVLVLDADALTSLGAFGVDILKKKTCKIVMTPHPKEFARLVQKPLDEVLQNAVALAESFAVEYGVTVAFKNNRTVITDGARTAINLTGSPALAKGGSGDVLAGFLAGTCARGVPLFEGALAASYLLGRAGELVSEALGEYSPDATEIIGYLPQAIKTL